MKHILKFNEMISIPTIALSTVAGFALIKLFTKLLSRNQNQDSNDTVSNLKLLLSRTVKIKMTKIDEGYSIELLNNNLSFRFILTDDKKLIINGLDTNLTNKEYSDFFDIIDKYQKIDKPLYPKVAKSSIIDSKYEAGLSPFSKEEIRIVESDINKKYKRIEVTDYKWDYKGENVEIDCSNNKAIGFQRSHKLKDKSPTIIIILKNVDDWFIITEWYDNWTRYLICDQFEELQNYIKSL